MGINDKDYDTYLKKIGFVLSFMTEGPAKAWADQVDDHLFLSELKVKEYFKSLVSRIGEDIIYPQFHGLPKIHKKPVFGP